jgi:ionotropic glutamate receptor
VNADINATREELSMQKDIHTIVFIVYMTFVMGTLIFSEAQNMEMMSNEYAWIITEGFSAILNVLKESRITSMQGILGTISYIPNSIRLLVFGPK